MHELTELPLHRPADRPFDPPAELAAVRDRSPLVRLRFPDGHRGWLATGYDVVRAVLTDPRFSSRPELMHMPFPGTEFTGPLPPAPLGDLTALDPPEHTRYRKLLTGKFTVRRMRLLTDRVTEIATGCLDAVTDLPVDLVATYAQPVPALMICELLGVPTTEREEFQRLATVLGDLDVAVADRIAAMGRLEAYVRSLIPAKRATPTDDLLSDLATTDLTDDELAGIGWFLLGAGMDTTANMLGLGTFALLRHPEQLAALRADPGLVDAAVEELMRYLTIAHTGARAALADVELADQVIRAGETVCLSLIAANRDPKRFPDPDVLDIRRRAAGHLGFGHGVHQCLGQQLARIELRVAFPLLLARFPALRLAVAPEEVPLRRSSIHGVTALPVR
jgi:cytochrome P450